MAGHPNQYPSSQQQTPAANNHQRAPSTEAKTLYEKLGSDEGCKTFADTCMKKIFADKNLAPYFNKT